MRWLLRLYPRWWRRRYGEEFAALLEDLSGTRGRLRLAVDVVAGALDARLEGMAAMKRALTDPAVRRGVYDGLVISGMTAVVVVLTNVVFPQGPDESDSDPEYLWQLAAAAVVLAALFVAVGFRGRRRGTDQSAGAKAGLAAGVVVAVLITLTFLAVNNAFFDIISQQHDKRVAFAASGWTSMRAYISVRQIEGLVILVPLGAAAGVVLGLLGAGLADRWWLFTRRWNGRGVPPRSLSD
jgi:uncharacterized membrane protein YozB (DUF420 family)